MNKRGFTLLEIIIATMLLASVMAGLMAIFVAGKRHVIHSRERMTGGELGKLFLDPVQMAVRQDTWDAAGNVLKIGSTSAVPTKVNNVDYTGEYDVNAVAGTDLRRVKVKVNWTELSP